MIKAFRIAKRVVLEVESDSVLERALLRSAARLRPPLPEPLLTASATHGQ